MFESKINRGRANGYAPLDGSGKVPLDKLPPIQSTINTGSFATTGSNTFTGNQTISGVSGPDGYASLNIGQTQIFTPDGYDIRTTGSYGATISVTSDAYSIIGAFTNINDYSGDLSAFSNSVIGGLVSDGPIAGISVQKSGSFQSAWLFNYDGKSYFPGDITIGYNSPIAAGMYSGSLNITNGDINLTGSLLMTGSITLNGVTYTNLTGNGGTAGESGTSGVDGTSGTSGVNGTSGESGTSGVNGTSGTSGESGTSGTSGLSIVASDFITNSQTSSFVIKTNVPTTSSGSLGDVAGMFAMDSTAMYYCTRSWSGGTQQLTSFINGTVTGGTGTSYYFSLTDVDLSGWNSIAPGGAKSKVINYSTFSGQTVLQFETTFNITGTGNQTWTFYNPMQYVVTSGATSGTWFVPQSFGVEPQIGWQIAIVGYGPYTITGVTEDAFSNWVITTNESVGAPTGTKTFLYSNVSPNIWVRTLWSTGTW